MKAINLIRNLTIGFGKLVKKQFTNPYSKVGFSWMQTRIVKNLPVDKNQSISFYNHTLFFKRRDELLNSINEIFIEEIYKQNLPSNAYIIDCGANIGLSVIYLKRLFPNSTIIAFEPDESNYQLLQKNIESFHLNKVELKQEAVWIENTTLSFSNTSTQMSKIEALKDGDKTITVKAVKLKDFLNLHVDFLKIDIEGAEYEVMKDIDGNLRNVNHLFVEYHGTFHQNKELNEIFEIITKNEFKYYIQQASNKHPTPFIPSYTADYDVQLNIFCFR